MYRTPTFAHILSTDKEFPSMWPLGSISENKNIRAAASRIPLYSYQGRNLSRLESSPHIFGSPTGSEVLIERCKRLTYG